MLRFFQNLEILIFANFLKKFGLDLEKKSTVLNGLIFPYLAKMITSIRGCVAYNDLWPWSISSRSFGLGLENRVRSVASKVPDGFFPYLVQMITGMRRCVACVCFFSGDRRSLFFRAIVDPFHQLHLGHLPTVGHHPVYIFQVIRPWLRKSCPLCSVYSCEWILFIFGTIDHHC